MVKEDLKRVGYLYILNKLLIIFLIWLTREILSPILPGNYEGMHPNVVLDSLIHWDAGWFLRVAGQGYDFDSAPFFPLFPLLIRLLTYVTKDAVSSGFLVSNTALFIACYLLYRLVREDYGAEVATTTTFTLLFFPTAVFFSSIYSESPFLAFALGTFYYARQKKWLAAAVLGSCAALTRNVGVVLFLALIYLSYKDNDYRLNLKQTLQLLLIPASLVVFMGVLWKYTGDPLAFAHSLNREYWSYRHFAYPGAGQFLNLSLFFKNSEFYSLFESGMAILFLFLVLQSFKYIEDRSHLIYLVLGFLIPFSSVVDNLPLGMPRYILVLFPGYVTLSRILHKHNLINVYSIISVFVFSVICVIFVIGRWIS